MPFPPPFIESLLKQAQDRVLGLLSPEKRRLVLLAATGALAVLLLIIIGVSLQGRSRRAQDLASARSPAPYRHAIPPDELFLPDEPDFVPGVQLEREQRAQWTVEDVEPFWQDPLRQGEQEWRDEIERTIDEIMESVP